MRKPEFTIVFILLAIAQILLSNYGDFSPFLTVTFLPMMILLLPIDRGTVFSLVIAFATGLAADFLSDGQLGLRTAALLPVAFARMDIIKLVFGQEAILRSENINFIRQGVMKITIGAAICNAIYLLVFIWLDGAGTRPFWFNLCQMSLSLPVNTVLALLVTKLMTIEDRSKWN